MTRGLVAALLAAVAVILQTAVVNRLSLPWGVAPDLVLLAVTALALRTGPATGAVAGFASGLAVDALPPADHEIGRYAMLLCLAGYLVGSLREPMAHSGLWPFGIVALSTVGVSLGYAFIGAVLGDPRVTVPAVLGTTPLVLLMTMVVSPFVLYPVFWVMRGLAENEFAAIGEAPWSNGGRTR
ncbi:rod shape-determining protein MreD [Spinactinospora alkalitolerans]|uniref:Rod shape-determining protein MreD n=1 Tax=Spinactinospora alkalitolerans TaxID=687207 RepID=A0A852TWX2_9ACTN|nr:rod shape-determining protein MreD [Spinactinospora alkalitolerans]NYE46360.1 rod shape-determining protein MreD [Spinactinospora alkalitolerans]